MPFSRSRSIESMTRVGDVLVGAEGAGLPEHGVDERRLAVVDVGDDRDVAEVLAGGGHALRLEGTREPRFAGGVEGAVVGRPRDLDAYEQLVREHQTIAFRTAYVITGTPPTPRRPCRTRS